MLPRALTLGWQCVALGLLAESFGRDVGWLWRHRSPRPAPHGAPQRSWLPRPLRRGVAVCATVLAVALVWFALVAPTRPDRLTPGAFVRLPVEAVASRRSPWSLSARSAGAP